MTNSPIKKAIITGASSGLGHALAGRLRMDGTTVVNLSRSSPGPDFQSIPTDLADNQSIAQAIAAVHRDHTDSDLLISCAGVLHWAETGRNIPEAVDSDIAINLSGMMKIVDGIIPIIEKNRGDVVIVGSTSSMAAPAGSAVYNAAKFGVRGYIKTLQTEFQDKDVRIIGFYPGGFKSPFHVKAGSPLNQESLMDPEELARLILSLISLPRNMQVSEIVVNRKAVRS